MSRFREKLLTDGRTDGQTLFQTTVAATAEEGPIKRKPVQKVIQQLRL